MHYLQPWQKNTEFNNSRLPSAKIIIAVDGHSSCGKSTTAKQVATQLKYTYIDTGAMYRAATLFFLQNDISINDFDYVNNALAKMSISLEFNTNSLRSETYLNGVNVENEIRNLYVSNAVSKVSALPEVRRVITEKQVDMGKKRGIVMDGRDIGTHVFPDAEFKIFMTADPVIRAQRRHLELVSKGYDVNLNEIIDNIKRRDHDDTTRVVSPLRQASDAVLIDTSYITISEQIERILKMANERISNLKLNFL